MKDWQHKDLWDTYNANYFRRSDGWLHVEAGKIRCGDTLAALCYALGFQSYAEVQKAFGFDGECRDYRDNSLTAEEIINKLQPLATRQPEHVVDVGGGRGELSCCFSNLGIPVQMIEPAKDGMIELLRTWRKLFGSGFPRVDFLSQPVPECLPALNLEKMDTLIFCESLEHIPQDCFDAFWLPARKALANNNGMLIIANWISFHPIGVTGVEHCRRVDDTLYDELAVGGRVVFREGSHLVVQFGE